MGKIRHSPVGSAAGEAHPACICALGSRLTITSVFHILNFRGRRSCAMPMDWLILERCLRISDEGTELDLLGSAPSWLQKAWSPTCLRLETIFLQESQGSILLCGVRAGLSVYRVSGTICQSRAACAGAVGGGDFYAVRSSLDEPHVTPLHCCTFTALHWPDCR